VDTRHLIGYLLLALLVAAIASAILWSRRQKRLEHERRSRRR